MKDKIDLDAIIADHQLKQSDPRVLWLNDEDWIAIKELMKEAARQALVLASEEAKVKQISSGDIGMWALSKLQIFEQDDVRRMEGKPEAQLQGSRIRIKVNETCYYSISVEDDGTIKVYKSGFP